MDKQNDRSKKDMALGLVIIASLVLLFWYLLSNNFNLFAGLIAGLTPSMITIYLQRENQKIEYQNWLLRNREAFLIDLIDMFISQVHAEKKVNGEEITERIINMQPAIIAHGSGDTLKAWAELTSPHAENASINETTNEIIKRGERFFRAIRKDLGHDDSDLPPGTIWATILKYEERQAAFDACKGEKYD